MGKRVSRHELVEKVRGLRCDLAIEKIQHLATKAEVENLKTRLRQIGERKVYTGKWVPCVSVNINPKAYGSYIQLCNRHPDKDALKMAKNVLARQLGEALLESGYIQFVLNNGETGDFLDVGSTVGAKIYVIPWDELAVYKEALKLPVEMECEDGERKTGRKGGGKKD